MIDTSSMFILLGVTLILGYVSMIIFKKTHIPDIIWLLSFGFLIGPVFNLIDKSTFIDISPLLASFALMIILFEAGMEMNFGKAVEQLPRSILLSFVGITLTILSVALASIYLFNFDIIRALLLGAIIGGPSSTIVISVLKKLDIRDDVRIILDLESILTDPVDVVLTLALVQIYTSSMPLNTIAQTMFGAFSIGALVGLLAGVVWLLLLRKMDDTLDYILTLAVLMLTFTISESLSGSGAISALVFGVMLASGGGRLSRLLKLSSECSISPSLKKFHCEVSFLVKSFFFVAMGIIVSINTEYVLQGIIITAAIAFTRILAVRLCTIGMGLTDLERNVMKVVIPQGLATAVMAYVPMIYGIKGSEIFLSVSFVVILATVIYTTVGIRVLYSSNKKTKPAQRP